MTVYIGHHAFSGPMDAVGQMVDRAGLYAVLIQPGRKQTVLCLDQAANVSSATAQRIKAGEFDRAEHPLFFAALYTPGVQASGRKHLLEEIRAALKEH
ncbi:MAG: hypothetical protein WBN65_08820 [Gammaproteobacteria bacterium]